MLVLDRRPNSLGDKGSGDLVTEVLDNMGRLRLEHSGEMERVCLHLITQHDPEETSVCPEGDQRALSSLFLQVFPSLPPLTP